MQKIPKRLLIAATMLSSFLALNWGTIAFAADPSTNCDSGSSVAVNTDPNAGATVKPITRQCDPALKANTCNDPNVTAANCDLVGQYLQPAVEFISALFGVGVVIAIIYGGIEYGSSGGDPQKAAAGKNRIRNAIVALLAYIFLYALLNFLIPGGIA